MKRWIHAREEISKLEPIIRLSFDIEVGVEWEKDDEAVAAATYKGAEVPEGPLLPWEKDALIDSQLLADYHAFIDSVEDLIVDYYDLHVYYKNNSDDNSFYFGLLAKNSDGSLVLDFDFRLRISNHDQHRSPQSQYNKKLQDKALLEVTDGKKLKPLRAYIVVNDKECKSYMEAYDKVDSAIEDAMEKLTRK